MVNSLDDDSFGIDIEDAIEEQNGDFDDMGLDIEQDATKQSEKKEPSWGDTAIDVLTQGARGIAKAFTWPADIMKVAMIGEGLSDLDELEESFHKQGKPFDREKYVKDVFELAQYVPTQDLAEQGFEELTGLSLQPKTKLGEGARQAAEIASFTPGGIAKKLTSGALGAATTHTLKEVGFSKGKAEAFGDIAGFSPSIVGKSAGKLTKQAEKQLKVAEKHGLPFLKYMTKERLPRVKGRISQNAEKRINDQFKMSTEEAIDKLITGEIPLKRYQDRGVNLDTLAERLYSRAERKAAKNNTPLKTENIVKDIDKEINRIKALAPSPSDSQKAAIDILERERDVMKISNPTPEQLINQHKNYNADMKAIYAKPEFNGKEEQVRKTYEFLKNQLVSTMENQGAKDVSEAFKAANKLYHKKSALDQSENIIEKAFDGEKYNPKKLQKLLHSKDGNYLRRNLGESAVKEIEEIAKYGKEAQEKIKQFAEINTSPVINEIRSWGKLGFATFLPHNLAAVGIAFVPAVAKRIQGALLTRPATREAYRVTLKHAADGAFNLLKKDFAKLEKEVEKEWGTVDDFIDDMMNELDISSPESSEK